MYSIPDYLSYSYVRQALRELSIEGVPPRQRSRNWCLEFDDRHFAPKTVISRAHLLQTGEELPVQEFYGGIPTNDWLRDCGGNGSDLIRTGSDLIRTMR